MKRLQSHPSVALWSGNNENEAALAQNWYHVPADKMPKAKDDYRTLYVGTVMRAVQEVDRGNNRPFITSSPTNGVESIRENYIATNPQDPLYGEFLYQSFLICDISKVFSVGDVHFYGFNNDSWNPTTYPITRFLSETGMISFPSLDTWLEVTRNASDLQYHSAFVAHREHDTKVYREPYVTPSCSSFHS